MKRYVDTAHGQVHVLEEGAGPALLLLGSAGRSGRVFEKLLPLLSPQFRTFAPDVLGCGSSDPPPAGATMTTFAESLIGMLDGLSVDRAYVYGLHTGNKLAAALAANWPPRIAGVALAGQPHSLIPNKAKRDAAIYENVAAYFEPAENEAQRLRKLWAGAFRRATELWWSAAIFADTPSLDALDSVRRAVIDRLESLHSVVPTYAANFDYDLEADLRRITSPALIIEILTPAEERSNGRQGDDLLKIIPHAQLVAFNESDIPSHMVTLENRYAELAELLAQFFSSEPMAC